MDTRLTVEVSAENFGTVTKPFVVSHSIIDTIRLAQLPGTLLVYAESIGGTPEEGFEIWINDRKTQYELGQKIVLPKAWYKIRLHKKMPDGSVEHAEFSVKIEPGKTTRKTAQIQVTQ
jgi:hypothetical protein